MSTTTQPLRLTTVRPVEPARRALLALAEALARLAVHRTDVRRAPTYGEARARIERDRDRLLALTPPLR